MAFNPFLSIYGGDDPLGDSAAQMGKIAQRMIEQFTVEAITGEPATTATTATSDAPALTLDEIARTCAELKAKVAQGLPYKSPLYFLITEHALSGELAQLPLEDGYSLFIMTPEMWDKFKVIDTFGYELVDWRLAGYEPRIRLTMFEAAYDNGPRQLLEGLGR